MNYAWFIWSLIFLAGWLVVYFSLSASESRKEMFAVSLWTSLLGFTEPFFVPEYWNPLSLFDLAQKTGFDIESFIFSFAIGGIAVVIYELIFRASRHKPIESHEQHSPRHRYHFFALLSAPIIFFLLIIFSSFNPIYSAMIAMMFGGFATWYCRPDLKKKMISSAFIFLGIYFVYFLTLILMYPGYVEKTWNLKVISGIFVLGIPLEELMFALSFGFLWSSVYEHFMWQKINK